MQSRVVKHRAESFSRAIALCGFLLLSVLSMQAMGEADIYFIHNDHLGTPIAVTNETQTVVWEASKLPFGETSTTGSISFEKRFPGQIVDEESGYYYNYFRDYDPIIGRYIQSDPIGLLGGSNTYAYVGGNPITRIDPTGRVYILLIPFFFDGPFGPSCGPAGSRLATWIPDGKAKQACDNHDFCYADNRSGKSQQSCDSEFRIDMALSGVNTLIADLYYCSVDRYGQESFLKARK